MALPMVHLAVAKEAMDRLHITDPAAYFLGAIAPDGIHMLEGWTPEEKQRSHLGTRRSGDAQPVAEFLARSETAENRDYVLGYAVHILTDVFWNETAVKEFHEKYSADPAPALEWRPAYYSDTDQIDIYLYHRWPERRKIWQLLEGAKAPELPGVLPARAAELWNRRTLDWYGQPREYPQPIRYITADTVQEFLPRAGEYCAAFLAEHSKTV